MKYFVTPDFSKKIGSLPASAHLAASKVVSFVASVDTARLFSGDPNIGVRQLGSEFFTLTYANYRFYANLVHDREGDYLLFLDVAFEASQPVATGTGRFFATKDPRTNPMIDPSRNMTIDPRRNMMIDPNRNMMIDPNRNMTIDPRRNMTIDPNRNMTIDPRRNFTIDPRRNMTIDPRRNRFYGGPYIYTPDLAQIGFVVRANETVSLTFDMEAHFTGFYVATEQNNLNIFSVSGTWEGFLTRANQEVLLMFDTRCNWTGLIV